MRSGMLLISLSVSTIADTPHRFVHLHLLLSNADVYVDADLNQIQ